MSQEEFVEWLFDVGLVFCAVTVLVLVVLLLYESYKRLWGCWMSMRLVGKHTKVEVSEMPFSQHDQSERKEEMKEKELEKAFEKIEQPEPKLKVQGLVTPSDKDKERHRKLLEIYRLCAECQVPTPHDVREHFDFQPLSEAPRELPDKLTDLTYTISQEADGRSLIVIGVTLPIAKVIITAPIDFGPYKKPVSEEQPHNDHPRQVEGPTAETTWCNCLTCCNVRRSIMDNGPLPEGY